jgi:hypothetical protein
MFYETGVRGAREKKGEPKSENKKLKREKEMENSPKNITLEAFNRERKLFIAVSVEAYRKRLLKGNERPTQYDVAEELRRSRATLNRQIAKYQTSWTEIGLLANCDGCWRMSSRQNLLIGETD